MTDDRTGYGGDAGVSSDDLLKAAKAQFGLDDGSSGIAESLLESSIDTTPDAAAAVLFSIDEVAAALAGSATADAEYATTPGTDFTTPSATDLTAAELPVAERDVTRGSDDLIRDTAGPQAPGAREAEGTRFTIPDPGVPTGLPAEPMEVDVDEMLAGLPVPPQASAPAGGLLSVLWRNRWIVVVAVIGVSVLAGVLDRPAGDEDVGSEPISDVAVGDCLSYPIAGTSEEIDVVDCSDEHDIEVFATISLSGTGYPGDTEIIEPAFTDCVSHFGRYVGEPYETSTLYLWFLAPTEGSWNDGDRDVLCYVYESVPGTDGAEIKPRNGSVRDSGL